MPSPRIGPLEPTRKQHDATAIDLRRGRTSAVRRRTSQWVSVVLGEFRSDRYNGAMERRHSTSHLDHFERHGWVLIERLLSEQEIDAAHPGLFALYPTPEEFHSGTGDTRIAAFRGGADAAANQGTDPRFRPLQFVGLKEFPFVDQALNLLALHPAIIAVAEDLLHT